jgi:PKD repeat protein
MKTIIPSNMVKNIFYCILVIMITGFSDSENSLKNAKATAGGEVTFTIRTVTAGGNYAPKHVLAIWIEKDGNFVKTRKAMANQRKQYLYTWKAASNYNVVDAITGATLTSHQTHTVTWNCKDLDGNTVPDGDYVIRTEFTDQHAQGPLYSLTFTKGANNQALNPPDETYFKDITLQFTPHIADFEANTISACQEEPVTFTDLSINATSWLWNFGEGAIPGTANGQGPHSITYSTAGSKTVSLTINGNVTEIKENMISVAIAPAAGFSYQENNLTIEFTNNSVNAITYLWSFGDGNTSVLENPSHTYPAQGTYTVSLTAINPQCEDVVTSELMVGTTGNAVTHDVLPIEISPNPSNGLFVVRSADFLGRVNCKIFNLSGILLEQTFIDFSDYHIENQISLQEYPAGIYIIDLHDGNTGKVTKVIKK